MSLMSLTGVNWINPKPATSSCIDRGASVLVLRTHYVVCIPAYPYVDRPCAWADNFF